MAEEGSGDNLPKSVNKTTTEKGMFPFKEQPTVKIGWGVEFKVLKHGDGWVVKEGVHPDVNTLEHLAEDKNDFEIFDKYLHDFLPETQHIRGHNSDGLAVNIIRQKEIKGRPLFKVSDEEISSEAIRLQLISLLTGCKEMWKEEGRILDIYGVKGGGFMSTINPRFSQNIMIEDGTNKVWLVDTSANRLGFSKEAALKYQFPIALLRIGINHFLNKLTK